MDEETFARSFGVCDWAIMFILARGGKTYARLRFNVGPGGIDDHPVEVNYRRPFAAADHPAWEAEYQAHILPATLDRIACAGLVSGIADDQCFDARLLDDLARVAGELDRRWVPEHRMARGIYPLPGV